MTELGAYVHDARHRYSVELRPDDALDSAIRGLAVELEAAGCIALGAATAPRFHPHLTLLRCAELPADTCEQVAAVVPSEVTFDEVATFGDGRIVYLACSDDSPARAARAAALDSMDDATVDPLVFEREWTPHVTVAYAALDGKYDAALELVRAALPVCGAWGSVEAWDLDVRPTVLVQRARK